MDQDVRPLGESIFSSSPFCFRVARVFRGSTCFFPFNVSKAGFVLAVSYLRPWSFICGSIAVFGFSRRSATPDQMIGCGPWAEAHGYHRCLAPRDRKRMSKPQRLAPRGTSGCEFSGSVARHRLMLNGSLWVNRPDQPKFPV